MEFLKKHYEKILLCLVLLGLAGAAVWMKAAIDDMKRGVPEPTNAVSSEGGPRRGPRRGPPGPTAAEPKGMDLSEDLQALAQITNPPPVVLSGGHNLFNPVTWKRKTNGDLFKVLKSGPDAVTVTNITPLYTVITFDHPSGDGGIYVISVQQHVELQQAGTTYHKAVEYAKKDQKTKTGVFIVRGIKGAENEPTEVNLEIPQSGETNVWISTNTPYKRVDSYLADLKYDPETKVLLKQKVDDWIKLDNEMYKIVEITNNAVRLQSSTSSKVTEIKWTGSQKKD
jgi:hypothetical protein